MKKHHQQDGITLLITLLLMGVLLGVSTALLGVTLKQYQLAGISYDSEVAFQAASAVIECALHHDYELFPNSPFNVPSDPLGPNVFAKQSVRPSMTCMGITVQSTVRPNDPWYSWDLDTVNHLAMIGNEQYFQFDWGNTCSEVSIYKFLEPVALDPDTNANWAVMVGNTDFRPGSPCPEGSTCTVVQARGYNVSCANINTAPRVVEREYTQVY